MIRDSRRTHPRIRRDTRPAIAVHPKVAHQYSVKRPSNNRSNNKVPTAAQLSTSVPAPIEIH